jgi:protein-disulfide isomerase
LAPLEGETALRHVFAVLIGSAGIALVLASIISLETGPRIQPGDPELPIEPNLTIARLSEGRTPTLGPPDAPYKFILFTDFECPSCRTEWQLISDYVEQYPQTSVTLRHFPLEGMHSYARRAAVYIESARRLGGASAACDTMATVNLPTDLVSLITEQEASEADRQAAEALVNEDLALGKSLGLNSTPTLFLSPKDGKLYRVRRFDLLTLIDR